MKDRHEAVNSYISDMLALEKHIAKALEGQIVDLNSYPNVTRELSAILGTAESHASRLESLLKERGGDGAGPLKKAGSALLGFAAGAVDLVRKEGLPKNLRDDYTACSLATIGYVMLHATAVSLDEERVAAAAHEHLRDYAKVVMTLHNVIPGVVIRFLQDEGLPASEARLEEIGRNIEDVWRSQSGDVVDPHEASV